MTINAILNKYNIKNDELKNELQFYIQKKFIEFTTNIDDAIEYSASYAGIDYRS